MNDAIAILKQLHDSEINGSIEWFYDGGFVAKLGDAYNGVVAEARFDDPAGAVAWLATEARARFPDSDFAQLRHGQ